MGYRPSASRRRISVTSQPPSAANATSPTSPPLSTYSPALVAFGGNAPSGLTRQNSISLPAQAERALQSISGGSPSPLRREASLLSISRDPLATSTSGGIVTSGPAIDSSPSYLAAMKSNRQPTMMTFLPASTGMTSENLGKNDMSATSGFGQKVTTPSSSPTKQSPPLQISPKSSLSRSSSGYLSANRPSQPTTGYQFPPTSNSGPGSSPSGSGSTGSNPYGLTSPPQSSPLALSNSNPGLDSRLPAISRFPLASRGTHGRSESLSSSIPLSSASGGSGNQSLSTSPSTSFRSFPSAPPMPNPSSNTFSPTSTAQAHLASPSSSHPGSAALGYSPPSSVSSFGSRAEAGGFKLQRVPTSVRLAQDLHPHMSPITERRRSSLDAAFALSAAGVASTGSKYGVGVVGTSSSSETSSETEWKGNASSHSHTGAKLPATPVATRQNSPSPNTSADEREILQSSSAHRSPKLLASPFPSSSLTQSSPSVNPPRTTSSAFSPLFPFSMPSYTSDTHTGSSAASVSRSHSRTRSKGSPLHNRISSRMNQDSLASAGSATSAHIVTPSVPEEIVSPTSASFSESSAGRSPSTLERIVTVNLSDTGSLQAGPSPEARLPSSVDVSELGREMVANTNLGGAALSAATSPSSDRRKGFRTSMLPGPTSASVSSSEDYARHLQESRASKLKKWANNANAAGGESGAGNPISGSDFAAERTIRARRRGGMPDFAEFGFSAAAISGESDYRDELGGDAGARPGTAGSRDIEWVDWLEEYKQMKEAKIRAEHEEKEQETEGRAIPDRVGISSELPEPAATAAMLDTQAEATDQVETDLTVSSARRSSGDKLGANLRDDIYAGERAGKSALRHWVASSEVTGAIA